MELHVLVDGWNVPMKSMFRRFFSYRLLVTPLHSLYPHCNSLLHLLHFFLFSVASQRLFLFLWVRYWSMCGICQWNHCPGTFSVIVKHCILHFHCFYIFIYNFHVLFHFTILFLLHFTFLLFQLHFTFLFFCLQFTFLFFCLQFTFLFFCLQFTFLFFCLQFSVYSLLSSVSVYNAVARFLRCYAYITLHYIALHYICFSLHYITTRLSEPLHVTLHLHYMAFWAVTVYITFTFIPGFLSRYSLHYIFIDLAFWAVTHYIYIYITWLSEPLHYS